MKNVLIITCHFPPMRSMGMVRVMGLAKYLPAHGWFPIFIMPDNGIKPLQYKDCVTIVTPFQSILLELTQAVVGSNIYGNTTALVRKIYLSKHIGHQLLVRINKIIKEIFYIPDIYIKWAPTAIKFAKEAIIRYRVSAIISESSPNTTHIIAHRLKQSFNIPWIADFRDLWTQNHYYPYSKLRHYFEKKLEYRTLKIADALITVSGPLSMKLSENFPDKKIFTITNGFDEDELAPSNFPLTNKFTITYTGNLYKGKRDPTILFAALSSLIKDGKINESDIEIRFYTSNEPFLFDLIKKYGLSNIVKFYGIVPRDEAIKAQRESQLLLLLTWNDPSEQGVYTGKIFEYLAARRPIIALGGKGVAVSLLSESNAGTYAGAISEMQKILLNFYKIYKERGYIPYDGKYEIIKNYTHNVMAKKFADVLNMIISLS